jgi:hypothetical protein
MGERFVDHHHGLARRRVARIEEAARQELRTDGIEIPITCRDELRRHAFVIAAGDLPLNAERVAPADLERQRIGDAHGSHARLLARRIEKRRIKLLHLRPVAR